MTAIRPSADFRKKLRQRGGAEAFRCYQCATCSSVCELATPDRPFPRSQMLAAQWGLLDKLSGDAAVWLCHQCNDCTLRCPRDARPGDVMQVVRGLLVESLATPKIMGKLVGNAATTWPLLLGIPAAFWILVLYSLGSLHSITQEPEPLVYDTVVPHWLIYAVFFPMAGYILLAAGSSAYRFWQLLGQQSVRSGSFAQSFMSVVWDILFHRRFATCTTARPRRLGHLFLLWGFIGAAVTSGLIIVAMYIMHEPLPLPLMHPFKILGNVSAVFLVVGGGALVIGRIIDKEHAGTSTAFDSFFITVVVLVIASGVLVEVGRFVWVPELAVGLYICHLTAVTCLFITFPYSKFSHMLYRTLAMVHEHMAVQPQTATAETDDEEPEEENEVESPSDDDEESP